jgi:septal ring factor EnvC (AmiA/AmiB activator)
MIRRAAILALALLALAAPPPAAADPAATARAAALELLTAVEGLAEARRARDQVTALTATIAAHEHGLEALRAGLREASLREAEVARALERQTETTQRLLAAMMAMGRVEGPALLLHPAGPLATARAGMLAADLVPAVQAEADRLAGLMRELRELRELRQTGVTTLTAALTSLQTARADLGQAIAERRAPAPELTFDEARLLALLESAQTLEALAAGLDRLPPGAGAVAEGFAQARGALPLPVRATLLRRAGEADAAGTRRPGILLATEPGALVTAPWAGTLRYRGPLTDYGNVILLEPDEGYVLLMAGLGVVYPQINEVVPAGAPLGLMPGDAVAGVEFAPSTTAAIRSETLYVELRHRGRPIDPGDWFAMNGAQP